MFYLHIYYIFVTAGQTAEFFKGIPGVITVQRRVLKLFNQKKFNTYLQTTPVF